MNDDENSPAGCHHNHSLLQIHPNGFVVVLALGLVPDVDLDVAVGAVVGDRGQRHHTGYPGLAHRQAGWVNGNRAQRLLGGSMQRVVDPAGIEPGPVLERIDGFGLAEEIVWAVGRGV